MHIFINYPHLLFIHLIRFTLETNKIKRICLFLFIINVYYIGGGYIVQWT